MDGRNRSVNCTQQIGLRLPAELILLVRRYQNDRRMTSISDAFRELLETHPRIDTVIKSIYAEGSQQTTPEGQD